MSAELPSIPEAISDLATFRLFARKAVEGTLTGAHRSGLFGSSIEFAEHKPYSAGDDLRHVDWKVFGRADRYYVKRFEDETNLRAYLVVDSSGSMNFGTTGFTKGAYASLLAATVAYSLMIQQDLVSLLRFGGDEPEYVPPRGRLPHFQVVTERLQAPPIGGSKKIGEALELLRDRIHRRGFVVILSDFLGSSFEGETFSRWARIVNPREHDIYWLQILDPAEIDFPFSDYTRFEGLEGEEAMEVRAAEAARRYRSEVERWCEEVRRGAVEHGIHYRLIRTDEAIHHVLASLSS